MADTEEIPTLRLAQGRLSRKRGEKWGTRRMVRSQLLRLLLQGDGELGFAGDGGIVEGFAGAVALGGVEGEAAFQVIGQAGEAGFAVGVSADLEVELVKTAETVGDVNVYFRGVDCGAGGIGDDEIGGAGADCAIDDGDGLGVGRGRLGESCSGEGECEDEYRDRRYVFPAAVLLRHIFRHILKITPVVNSSTHYALVIKIPTLSRRAREGWGTHFSTDDQDLEIPDLVGFSGTYYQRSLPLHPCGEYNF